jgi:hypothetical protein
MKDPMAMTHESIILLRRLVVKALMATCLAAALGRATPAQTPPNLGTAAGFAVLGETSVTCSSSTVAGDAGVNSGAVSACTVLGTTHEGDPAAQQAYADFQTAYGARASVSCGFWLVGSLAGEILAPGVYCIDDTLKTGLLTLDGTANGIWIFKVGTGGTGALTATNFTVAKIGGGGACNDNVFWWTDQYATLTTSTVLGTILAGAAITVTGGSVDGRALATGTVTLTSTTVGWPATPVPPLVTGSSGNTCPAATAVLTASAGYSTYQWLFNGVPIVGATSSTYGATVTGNYSVEVTDGDGCAGASAGHAVLIVFCSTSEVSPVYAAFPARLTKSETGNYLYFQRIDAAEGYNLYEGNIGTWYSHKGAAGNVCHVSVNVLTDLGTGEMRAAITPSEGDHYYLVTAYAGSVEGPTGFASSGDERDPSQNTCPPPP